MGVFVGVILKHATLYVYCHNLCIRFQLLMGHNLVIYDYLGKVIPRSGVTSLFFFF